MLSITFETKKLKSLSDKLSKISGQQLLGGAIERALPNINAVLDFATSEQFSSLGARSNTPWKDLADGSNRPPLASLKERAQNYNLTLLDNSNIKIIRMTFSSFLVTIHNQGAKIKRTFKRRGNREIILPTRPIVRLIDKDKEEITKFVGLEVVSNLSKLLST